MEPHGGALPSGIMSPISRTRRLIFLWTAVGVVAVLVAVLAVVVLLPRERTTEAEWAESTLTASAFDTEIAIEEAPYDPAVATALATAVPTDYVALRPLEISAAGPLPDSGVTLALALAEALPADAAATFAFYDEELGIWVPEFTVVADDRRTLTAVVDHLSVWTVFTSGVADAAAAFGGAVEEVAAGIGEALDRGSKQLFRFTHELLGNAADDPQCAASAPWWVQETLLSDNTEIDLGLGEGGEGIDAVLLCAGSSPTDPEILEITAAGNRGYGFPVTLTDGLTPLTSGVSGVDPNITSVLQFATAFFADAGSFQVFDPDRFVFATQEYTATFDEQSLRAMGGGRILSFDMPNLGQVLLSSGIKWAMDAFTGGEMVTAILTILSLVRDCELAELDAARGPVEITTWLTACANAFDHDHIAGALDAVATEVAYDDEALAAAMKDKAKLVRTVAGKARMLLIFTIGQTLIDFVGDSVTESVSSYPAWFVQVMLAPERPAVETLFGVYTDRQPGGFFTSMSVGDGGIGISDCNGCGSVSVPESIVSATWNGSCFDIVNRIVLDWGGTFEREDEQWILCPKGFGGPGDDGVDRLGMPWRGQPPAQWYLRE